MVNIRESVINPVILNMPKMLLGMHQNGKWVAQGLRDSLAWTEAHRERADTYTSVVTCAKHGKPAFPPMRAG